MPSGNHHLETDFVCMGLSCREKEILSEREELKAGFAKASADAKSNQDR